MEPLYKVRTVPSPEMFEDMARVSMRKSPSTGLPWRSVSSGRCWGFCCCF